MVRVNLIPVGRRKQRERDYIRRLLRLSALGLTLSAVVWVTCNRRGPASAGTSMDDLVRAVRAPSS